jgi:hypothetical protein
MRLKTVLPPQIGHEIVRDCYSLVVFEVACHRPARPM